MGIYDGIIISPMNMHRQLGLRAFMACLTSASSMKDVRHRSLAHSACIVPTPGTEMIEAKNKVIHGTYRVKRLKQQKQQAM